jgi:hypothetical protein
VVDISQWPAAPRFSFDATRAPLVVYDKGTLEVLDGCTLRGVQATRTLTPAVEPQVIRTQEALEAALPLRDPALSIGGGLPIAVLSAPVEERRLVVIDDNTRPVEGACARATHVVTAVVRGGSAWRKHEIADRVIQIGEMTSPPLNERDRHADARLGEELQARCAQGAREGCDRPLSVTLAPLGQAKAVESATLMHLRAPEGERWIAEAGGAPLCSLPCDRWILPGAGVEMKRADGLGLSMRADFADGRERDLAISYEKDGLYPWLGVGLGIGGLGFIGAGVGVGVAGSGAGSSGSGSSGGQASANVLAPVLLGVLGGAIDIGALVYLLRGAQPVPTYRVDPKKTARAGRPGLSLSPSGVGIRF